jgi:hypothetical protein
MADIPERPRTLHPASQRAHDAAVADGRDHYIDPVSRLLVMTEIYLARRGYCCSNGCRHCPYTDNA